MVRSCTCSGRDVVAMIENSKDCTPRADPGLQPIQRCGRRRVLLLPPHGAAVGVNILVVFFHRPGKTVVTCGIGYEIVEVALRGMHGGLESALTGVADGARRKSRMSVGVVSRVESHVVVVQSTGVGSG